ncbi:hypothetical protein BU17DRAFT_55315 [Hysterangium stoloniferum]|nr:hypothetical protein BU17DRAFT_55315 [Hysterangium stoloniferum]
MKLWEVSTGRCLYMWEFPKPESVSHSARMMHKVICVMEQQMGYQCTIHVFNINRKGDGQDRASSF